MEISMARFNCWTSTLLAGLILFMILFDGRSLVDSEKIDARVDIVVILSNGHREHEVRDARPIKAPYKKLATHFELAVDKARLAAVVGIAEVRYEPKWFENYSWIRMNLSDDRVLYEKTVENYVTPLLDVRKQNFSYMFQWGRTFDLIRGQIFANAGSGRGKVVVFIMLGHGGWYVEDNEKAKKLREDGAWLYIVTVDLAAPQNTTMGGRAYNMTGDQQRVFVVNDTQYESLLVGAMDNVVNAIHRDLCQWDSACRYDGKERKQCQFEAWMPSPHPYMNKVQQCDKLKPMNRTCDSLEDCKEECNKRWPWEEKPCENKCGVNDGKRRGPAPPKMENCPQWIACPPCTGTSGTTTDDRGAARDITFDVQTEQNTMVIVVGVIGAIVVVVLLTLLIAVVVVLRRRFREKRLMALKSASTEAPAKPPLPVKKGPHGKEVHVATVSQRAADAAVAADISLRSRLSTTRQRPKSGPPAGKASVKSSPSKSAAAESTRTVLKKSASKSVISKAKQ